VRIVIASTGRSGTTWLQLLLTYIYEAVPAGARDFDPAANTFRDDPRGGLVGALLKRTANDRYRTWDELWRTLPERCVVHTHWAAYPAVVDELAARRYPVATMARHPLDILVSHLAWVNRSSHDDFGLPELRGLQPTSPAFVEWASSDLARWLLGITGGWWLRDGVVRLRYEDLIADPRGELARAVDEIGIAPLRSLDEAIAESELSRLKKEPAGLGQLVPQRQRAALHSLRRSLAKSDARAAFIDEHRARRHFWQGKPGLWRELLPMQQAQAIAGAHEELFGFFNYECDHDPGLTAEDAHETWTALLAG
jgi:Sulfotransferase domain